jgi:LPXTG-motif cell wall-anchored protein
MKQRNIVLAIVITVFVVSAVALICMGKSIGEAVSDIKTTQKEETVTTTMENETTETETTTEEPTVITTTEAPTTKKPVVTTETPDTGDTSAVFAAIATLSVASAAAFVCLKKKEN